MICRSRLRLRSRSRSPFCQPLRIDLLAHHEFPFPGALVVVGSVSVFEDVFHFGSGVGVSGPHFDQALEVVEDGDLDRIVLAGLSDRAEREVSEARRGLVVAL